MRGPMPATLNEPAICTVHQHLLFNSDGTPNTEKGGRTRRPSGPLEMVNHHPLWSRICISVEHDACWQGHHTAARGGSS